MPVTNYLQHTRLHKLPPKMQTAQYVNFFLPNCLLTNFT